jgi:CheY-like chemotaxis protein
LALWGHRVELAATGPEGVDLVVESRPDVAIIDIGLPGLDGYGVAQRVRATPLPRPPRLIALTGFGQTRDRERALEAGFDAHVVKPPDPATLRRMLANGGG